MRKPASSSSEVVDRASPLKVYVTPNDRATIQSRARQTGLSVSSYLTRIALNRPVRSVADIEAVMDLLRVNSTLGHLCKALETWLATRPGEGAPPEDVRKLLRATHELQHEMRVIASDICRRSRRDA